MGRLIQFAVAAGLFAATPAHADPLARWRPLIDEASVRFSVPSHWIERVMRAESGGRTELGGRPIRSRKGAIGLMQLMPATWADMRARLQLGDDPDNPRDNVLAGTLYLRMMYDRFGYPGLFAAYNAGPGRYAAWLSGRQDLPDETIAYLSTVGGRGATALPRSTVSLFVSREPNRSAAAEGRKTDPLFAIRKIAP